MRTKTQKTKQQQLKEKIIVMVRDLLTNKEQDIKTGIEEGIYDKSENKETLAIIKEQRKLIAEFEALQIEILVFVEGGVVHGASGSVPVNFQVFNKDNFDSGDENERKDFIENYGDPETWEEMIKSKTESGDIVGIF